MYVYVRRLLSEAINSSKNTQPANNKADKANGINKGRKDEVSEINYLLYLYKICNEVL
jgi:hypothetical protein